MGKSGQYAFLWDGTMHSLGTLGGTVSEAADINNRGQVVGMSMTKEGGFHAFLHTGKGQLTPADDIGTLGGVYSRAWAVNERGQVVGESDVGPFGPRHAFLYSHGHMQDLGTMDQWYKNAESTATDINNRGEIIGTSFDRPFIYTNGKMYDLNALIPAQKGRALTQAYAINDKGQIVGEGVSRKGPSAFLLIPQ